MTTIVKGATDQTIDIFVQDSSASTGVGLTGLVYNTSSLTCYYRKGATGTPTQLPLVTQTVGGAHADGGFVAVDGTNCPGQYRLDLSDTIVATGNDRVYLYLRGATNMSPVVKEIELVEAVTVTSGVVSANTTQIAGQTASASGTVTFPAATLASTTNITAGTVTTATNVTTVNGLAANVITATSIAADAITAAKIATGAIDADAIAADAVTEIQSGLATAAALAIVDDFLDTEIAAIKAKTDSLTFTVANQVDANIQSINDTTIVGNGASPKFGV